MSKTYNVKVKEYTTKWIEVVASSDEEAIEIAQEMYEEGEIDMMKDLDGVEAEFESFGPERDNAEFEGE